MKMNSVLKWLGKHRKSGNIVILLSFLPLASTGCYGNFPLTKAVYRFNGHVFDNEIATNVLFWIFVVFPVYGIAALGDAVIFNLINYWTGEGSIISEFQTENGDKVVFQPGPDGNSATLEIKTAAGDRHSLRFMRAGDGSCRVYDDLGNLCGFVVPRSDGSFCLQDASRSAIKTLPL